MSTGRLPSVDGGIQPTIVDAKGDLIVATAADTVSRLAVGSNNQVLTADSSTATGLKWADVSAGGMTLISQTVASGASSLSFSSIPGTYKQLFMIWSGIQNSSTSTLFNVRFNNDSSTNYYYFYIRGVGGTFGNQQNTGTTASNLSFNNNGSSANLEEQSQGSLLIDNYASTTKAKAYKWQNNFYRASDATSLSEISTGTYNSTSAITSIDIVRISGTGTFSNTGNTTIRLYGVS